MAAPLSKLASILQTFRWTPVAKVAFGQLKGLFLLAPILAHPDPRWQFVVEVDALDVGVGAILSQWSALDQKIQPCAFYNHWLSLVERNYDVENKDLLAVVLMLQEWRHWLEGAAQPFVLWTNHKNLTYPPYLVEAALDPVLHPSCILGAASWLVERVWEAQQSAPGPLKQLFISEGVRSDALQWAHASKLTYHPGVNRTLQFLRQRFWWPSMTRRIMLRPASCMPRSGITSTKSSHQPPAGLLQSLEILRRLWLRIAVAVFTGLLPAEGHQVILTVVDWFSKADHFIHLPKFLSAAETGEVLVQHMVRFHGIPRDIVSDRGSQFFCQVWKAFCLAMGALDSPTLGYHPQTNGQV